ncbi:MAG TPA: class I SAM-dependent methyltransferase [Chitinophagaceae bacterium]|nr:class I SAM-dependent methyltransferase [Chitinophagaceae bacterium]
MKKLLHNFYNFFYVAFNWNLLLAFFVTWHEIRRGSKYNINTIKPVSLDDLTIAEGDRTKSSAYEALNYYILENLLDNFRRLFPNEKNLVDVGSGKGRIMVVAAHYGFTRITGIDFAKELCEAARSNVNKIKERFPGTTFTIHCKDVVNYDINAEDKVFFLFNPFNKDIMEKFSERIDQSLRQHPRCIYVMYANPLHKKILLEKGYKEVFGIKKLRLLEGIILVRDPEL